MENRDEYGRLLDENGRPIKDDVKFWDLFNPNEPRTPEELASARLEVCKRCTFFKTVTQRCTKCGCFMKLKTTLENAKCPIGHW